MIYIIGIYRDKCDTYIVDKGPKHYHYKGKNSTHHASLLVSPIVRIITLGISRAITVYMIMAPVFQGP